MTPQQKSDAEARARAYIDEIIKINRKYGMGGNVSEETYQEVVKGSAEVFEGLISSSSEPKNLA